MATDKENKEGIEKLAKINTGKAEKISNKEARGDFNAIAPWILGINLAFAVIMYLASGFIFDEPQADYLGGLLAGSFTISGIISFIALKAMGKRVVMNEKIGKNK